MDSSVVGAVGDESDDTTEDACSSLWEEKGVGVGGVEVAVIPSLASPLKKSRHTTTGIQCVKAAQ